ncbi:MAG: DUF2851 family protein [Verrucomicrobia bacterium]|nr:DUF2851 family protein [Verrucomicrobiota bacterium]
MIQKCEEGQAAVAEIQGLYGPFSFPEKLLQQIWLRGDFDLRRARTTDGRAIIVRHPGRWNLLGGPDFKDARLTIGGVEMIGDVEIHLRAADWAAHRHATDPAYARVLLHVVLFPTEDRVTQGVEGTEIPLLVLLPLLNHDLEEYAADEAVERLADHPLAQARRELVALPMEKLEAELLRQAELRWQQKVRNAKLRIERLGWAEACHHTALEVLGYRFNRAPMLAVAGAVPLADWIGGGESFADEIYERFALLWSKQGVRPLNHPRARLRQYARCVAVRPDWPQRWLALAAELPVVTLAEAVRIAAVRRRTGVSALARRLAGEIFGEEIGGTRFNTLVCDGLLPLLAAQKGDAGGLVGLWHVWPVGDVPARFGQMLRELGVVDRRTRPLSHGIVQGLIGWLLVADERLLVSHPTGEGAGLDNASSQKLF